MQGHKMKREALSNIDVLIVGAGLGGLYAAIECYRQGHSPRIIESKDEVEALGQSSCARIRIPDRTNGLTDRGLRWHWAFCGQPVPKMARHAKNIQQHHLSAGNDFTHT